MKNTTKQQVTKKVLTILRIINVGGTTKRKLIKTIRQIPAEINYLASDLMNKEVFKIAIESGTVNLVLLELGTDLGFTENPLTDKFMTKEFCTKWSAKHLDGYVIELCEPEDGPQLRSQYAYQPTEEYLWMEFI